MEPTADGLVEVTSDLQPGAPVLEEAVAALTSNGHDITALDLGIMGLLHAAADAGRQPAGNLI